ncbi:RNA polymerase sigma factor [Echinicola shivajiensis]|uniref:RNA polymerase sigma factor n=1 Tax=Echinicola shivajiensis TaxID=1035916 RepID=UPI001BFC0419|nr:sigma-70 family RNA polymerase sigma factor [Echinicola shivajiensis]
MLNREEKVEKLRSEKFEFDFCIGGGSSLSRNNEQNERLIWESFINGDEDSLIYIYRNYANILFRYARQFTSRNEYIRDCIQELFYELIDRRSKLSKVDSIKGYLFVSLKRKILKGIKKEEKIRFENEGFSLHLEQDNRSISTTVDDLDLGLIKQALKNLPVNQREIILLYFYEGLSYQDIAGVMGIKVRSARALAYRSLDSLQKELGPHKKQLLSILLSLCGGV